jgi:hypothetical protein
MLSLYYGSQVLCALYGFSLLSVLVWSILKHRPVIFTTSALLFAVWFVGLGFGGLG